MKRDFVRNKRITEGKIPPLSIKIAKRVSKSNSGIAQALVNVVVYVLIFVLFFKDNLQFMGLFIAFMVASIVAQLIIRFGHSVRKSKRFPFFRIVGDLKLYKNYLENVEKEIDEYIEKYDEWLRSNLFPVSELDKFIDNLSPQLYSRLSIHSDFLTLNLGQTYIRYPITLTFPTYTYNENDEILNQFESEIDKKISDKSKSVLPFAFSLRDYKNIAFTNKGIPMDEFMRIINSIIIDIAVFQSYEELVLSFVFDPESELYWVRFLPHVWFGNRRLVFCDTEPESEFTNLLNEAVADKTKYIVTFANTDFAQTHQFYDTFNNASLPDNLSVVFFSQSGNTPSRITHNIDCTMSGNKLIGIYEGHRLLLNSLSQENSEELARKMFNIRLIDNHAITSNAIPDRLTFFELFGIKSAANIPTATINENKIIQSHFPIKVGLGNERREVYIDLTNDGDGNHCLVTGTNGSGKSEFMLTYVLTACSKYQPDYFAFVAIDFKGGAMSSKIRNLPHCLGEFTNSSGDVSKREVTRIAELLESEISYRELIMKEVNCANDLPKYHRLYSEGKVKTPLPRLLIVVDEVAVFFAKDNTSVNYITHIATVGRAVGMILLLATQSKSGVIPSQVKTNINVNVEFYSEDENKKNNEMIKGRAIINSHMKKDCECQVALSAIFDSNLAVVDFITLSAKSRIISGRERYTQFDQTFDEILRRYPQKTYFEMLDEVITAPLESCIEDRLSLLDLQDLYYGDPENAKTSYPIGVSDNIYLRKREFFVFTPASYNLLVFGKPQSGKTTFIKSLLVSMFHKSFGLRPNAISVYVVAKNSSEYASYCFPHIGNILPERDLYYFLLYLVNEINHRGEQSEKKVFPPIVAIIDDCYSAVQQSEELTRMLTFVTNESVKYGVSIVMTLPFKPGFGNAALKNFGSKIAFHMGDDFDYSAIMHLDSIKHLPDIKGRCLVDIAGDENRTLETQITFPYEISENEVAVMAKEYLDLWRKKNTPITIPLMPDIVTMPIDTELRRVPVGKAKDLSTVSWNLGLANTYLISYFSDTDAIAFVKYLVAAFVKLGFDIILVDNQRNSLREMKNRTKVTYFLCDEQSELKNTLEAFNNADSVNTVLIMFDFVKCLFPSYGEEKELIKIIDELVRGHKLFGVFADFKDFLNVSRNSSTRFGQYLEGVNSGLLLGNEPSNHTYGFYGLPTNEQTRPLDTGWGVNVSPSSSETKRIKIATEAE